MFAIDDSASIFCARLMRGTMSIAMTVAPLAAARLSRSPFCAGQKNAISICPERQQVDLGLRGRRAPSPTTSAAREDRRRIRQNLDPGRGIDRIRYPRPNPGPRLDTDRIPKLAKLLNRPRRQRHTVLASKLFRDYAELHPASSLFLTHADRPAPRRAASAACVPHMPRMSGRSVPQGGVPRPG